MGCYVTVRQNPRYHQMTLDEVLSGTVSIDDFIQHDPTGTRTRYAQTLKKELLERYDFPAMIATMEAFTEKHKVLYEAERSSLYTSFYLAKKSGGLRPINAPLKPLMDALNDLKEIFETRMFALYHTSAFAYIKKRCPKKAMIRHQANGSNWFLKLDFTNFFGSTTPDFLLSQLEIIFPFSYVMQNPHGRTVLKRALDLCFLNGGLPQGTVSLIPGCKYSAI